MAQGSNEKISPEQYDRINAEQIKAGRVIHRGYEDEPEREPNIIDRVERLRKSVEVQSMLNATLEEKLQYILTPEPPTSDGDNASGMKQDYPRSSIEETLIVLETQFAYQARRTEAIMRRINL